MSYLICIFGGLIAGAAGTFLFMRKNAAKVGAVITAVTDPPKP